MIGPFGEIAVRIVNVFIQVIVASPCISKHDFILLSTNVRIPLINRLYQY